MQNLVPSSAAAPAQRSSLLTVNGLSSPLPGAASTSESHNSFRPSGLAASSSFFPSGGTSSATTSSLKPASLPASANYQPLRPNLTSSMTFKPGSFSSVPASAGFGGGMIRSHVPAASASTGVMGYKPAGIGASMPSASPSADRKSAYGPGLLRLSSQMSGAGGVSSQLGQRFGTAVSLSANNAMPPAVQAPMPTVAGA